MTLSRKAIRPAQTEYLIAHDFLPVSIDYRLCPETTLLEGPITDVCDAYRWCLSTLPKLARERGFIIDEDRIVVIGWSTGGHLALSLAWTTLNAGLPPPIGLLSFYAPVDFQSGGEFSEVSPTECAVLTSSFLGPRARQCPFVKSPRAQSQPGTDPRVFVFSSGKSSPDPSLQNSFGNAVDGSLTVE